MASRTLVSVIIGTRNRPDTLAQALASIRALEGDDLAFEILVGDNGDDPRTEAVVAAYGGIYGKTSTYGCPAARNVAMAKVSGEFIAFLDDDDVWLPGHIRPHLALMRERPELAAVFGQIQSTNQDLVPEGAPWPSELSTEKDLFLTMMAGYFPQVGGTVVRARLLPELGLMDETLIGDSDWDWQLRIVRDHAVGFVPVPCVLFRQRPRGTFNTLQMTRVGYTRKIFWRHALRQRHRWKNWRSLLRDYCKAVEGYHQYFMNDAVERAFRGERVAALSAVISSARILPHRTAKALIKPSPLRRAVLGVTRGEAP